MRVLLTIQIIFCCIALLGVQIGSLAESSAYGDELEDLNKLYQEFAAERAKYLLIVRNPDDYDDAELKDAIKQVGQLDVNLEQLLKDIKTLGGQKPVTKKLNTKHNDGVRASDSESGAETTRKSEAHCDCSMQYVRPHYPETEIKITLIDLPEFWNTKAATLEAGKSLIATEQALIMHLVACEETWTRKSAVAWADKRNTLAGMLIKQEQAFCVALAGRYNDEENAMIGKAYKQKPGLRQAINAEKESWKKYADYVPEAAHVCVISRYSNNLPDKLACAKAMLYLEKLYRDWEKASVKVSSLRGIEMTWLENAEKSRADRGFKLIGELYPDCKFTKHDAKIFTTINVKSPDGTIVDNPVIKLLLGKEGMAIIKSESRRRRKAARQ